MLDALLRARVAELADREARMRPLRGGHRVQHGLDPVGRRLLVAADLEVDQRRSPVLRDRPGVYVLHHRHARHLFDHVLDRRPERRIAGAQRAALDEDGLGGGLPEACPEDGVHPAGLARPGCVGVDVRRPGGASERDRDGDECEPAEGGRLPVGGAPAADAGCEARVSWSLRHCRPPLGCGRRMHATTLGSNRWAVVVREARSTSDVPPISSPPQGGGAAVSPGVPSSL